MSLADDLKKQYTKPPLPKKSGKPNITIVRVTVPLATFTYRVDNNFTFNGFSVEIDDEYAYIQNHYFSDPKDAKKPDWLMTPDPKDLILWFAQSPYNTVIIHQDKKYSLVHVKRGKRRQVPCSQSWCKEFHRQQIAVKWKTSCVGHNGAPAGFTYIYDKYWILKPLVLPPESEDWVNKHLGEAL